MGTQSEEHASKFLGAQSHVWNHTYSFLKSMSLRCAIELSIPDVIHKYGQPMPLSQLIASLPIHPSKTTFIYRLMRILTHAGFFNQHNATENGQLEARYELTDASLLLLKNHAFSMIPYLHMTFHPSGMMPWYKFSAWLKNGDPTLFEAEYGTTFWDYAANDPKMNHLFNGAIESETQLVANAVIENCKEVFTGLESLVDVGGGKGTVAKAIAKSFPQIECIVFDLPHVVAGLEGSKNLKYAGGDMFDTIPSADSILLKSVLHNWKDEECVKILKKCKDAITRQRKQGGKVIIIDMIMDNEKEEKELVEAKLFFDMQMMMLFSAKERNEKEFAKLIFSAGFSDYKIIQVIGLRSLIEAYP